MMVSKLRKASRISRNRAKDLILAMARYSDHGYSEKFETLQDVHDFYERRGEDLRTIIEDVRNGGGVPYFQNFVGPTFFVAGEGTGFRASIMRMDTNEEIAGIQGEGSLSFLVYVETFSHARRTLLSALKSRSHEELKVAIERGVASVEAYLRYRQDEWNRSHPDDLLIDTSTTKIPFTTKIDQWIPKMSGGNRVNKGGLNGQDFFQLKEFRDEFVVHPKTTAQGITTPQFANLANQFRTGIAGFLVDLHLIFFARPFSYYSRGVFCGHCH